MTYVKHNDYEILKEIREGNPDALKLMFDKYQGLIAKTIRRFNLTYDYDDMMQEAYMIVHKSIRSFDPAMNKTFTRYVQLNIERRFISIVTKRVRRSEIFKHNSSYIYEHNHDTYQPSAYYELYKKEIANLLTKREYLIYTLRELRNYSIGYIATKLDIKDKTVYNCLTRARRKIREHFQSGT